MTRDTVRSVVIVGAGLAGSRCAETLRAEGFDGRVVVIGEEPDPPYRRPALSKELLAGAVEPADLHLRPAGFWAQAGIELVLGTRVCRIDLGDRRVVSDDGKVYGWDVLVLASGACPRTLPGLPKLQGVHHLRTLGQALALRRELEPGSSLAVIGAGFIGAEVASTARGCGVDVTLVEVADVPLERVLGRQVGVLLAERYRSHGVRVILGTGVGGLRADDAGRVRAVVLADGQEVPCDGALIGIGVSPALAALSENLDVAPDGGVATDACGRTSVPSVYACGDVASSWRPSLDASLRVEHWTSAAGQGAAVARTILGRERPHDDVPYFWSDQFGLRLQYVGHASTWDWVEIDGDDESFVARYFAHRRLLAVLLANRPHEVGALRRELGQRRGRAAA